MIDRFVGEKIAQPKKEIITFLASKGMRTVVVYDDPSQMKEGDLWRSEHPQDYEGSSDLFPNARYGNPALDVDNITKSILSQDGQGIRYAVQQIRLHCRLIGCDYDGFVKKLSHTPWEMMEGSNKVICADSVVPGKYHIIEIYPHTAYDILENGRAWRITDQGESLPLKEANGLIQLYEDVRACLDQNHCYIVETVTQRNRQNPSYSHFAAQVHRGVDSQRVDFQAKAKRWCSRSIRFHNVRGATSSAEGEELSLTLQYPRRFKTDPEIIEEDGSVEASVHDVPTVFSEIMFRRRGLQIYPNDGYLRDDLNSHCSRNLLLKPACSVVAYGRELWNMLPDLIRRDGLVQVRVHFVSDGQVAHLSLLE